jgi:acetoin utilization protein AcuB
MNKMAGDFIESHVIYVKESDSMTKAWQMMRDNGIRHLVVYGEEHKMVGVLSDRDVKLAMTTFIDTEAGKRKVRITLDPDLLVSDFMSFPVEYVGLETPVSQIAKRMVEQKISAVVVFDQGRVHGLISYEDLLKEYMELSSIAEEAA